MSCLQCFALANINLKELHEIKLFFHSFTDIGKVVFSSALFVIFLLIANAENIIFPMSVRL